MALGVSPNVCVFEDKLYKWCNTRSLLASFICQLEVFDLHTYRWYAQPVKATKGSSYPLAFNSASDNIGSSMYFFGGQWTIYCNYLFKIDLRTYLLEEIVPTNPYEAPMPKGSCGMVAINTTKLLVFGGFGASPRGEQPGAWYVEAFLGATVTNETHLFDLEARQWSNIEAVGTRPPPCHSFSFTRIDVDRIILFGGCLVDDTIVNDIYILDTQTWTWSLISQNMYPGSPWPLGRELHSAVPLVDPASIPGRNRVSNGSSGTSGMDQKLMVLWGSGAGNEPTRDCWALKVKNFKWERISPPAHVEDRCRHVSAVYYPTSGEAIIVTTGGYVEEYKHAKGRCPCPNCNSTVIIFSGVRSLYNLCLDAIVRQIQLWSTTALNPLLPRRVSADLKRCLEFRNAQFSSFTL